MAGQEDEPEPFTAGPATDEPDGPEELIRAGAGSSDSSTAPPGSPRSATATSVSWDEGSARLLDALGVTSPTTGDNAPGRFRVVGAYCDALEGRRGQGHRAWLMTASSSTRPSRAVLAAGEDGESHSG